MAATPPRPKGQKKGLKGTLKRMFSSRNQEKKGRPTINVDFSKIPNDNAVPRPQRRHSFTASVEAAADDDSVTIFPRSLDLAHDAESMPSLVGASSLSRTDKRRKELNDRISRTQRKLEQLEREIDVFLAKLEAAIADQELSSVVFAEVKKKKGCGDGLKDKNSGADAVWFGTKARDSVECLLEKLKKENNGRTPNWAKTNKPSKDKPSPPQSVTGVAFTADSQETMTEARDSIDCLLEKLMKENNGRMPHWARMGEWAKKIKRPNDETSRQSTTVEMDAATERQEATPVTDADETSIPISTYCYDYCYDSNGKDTSSSSSVTATKWWTNVSRRRQQEPTRRRPSVPLKGHTRLVVGLLEAFQRKPLEERRELIRSGFHLLRVFLIDHKQQTANADKEDVAKPNKKN